MPDDSGVLASQLRQVGVPDHQVLELVRLLLAVAADEPAAHRAEVLEALLGKQVGQLFERGSVFEPSDFVIGPGHGAVPLLALLRARTVVERYWSDLGLPEEVRHDTAAEIGRQTTKTERVNGYVGLADAAWVETVFRGGFAQIGRLQFELINDEGRKQYVLNTHIPEGGPLGAEAVADSLKGGRALMSVAFPQYGPIRMAVCDSWLLDPQLAKLAPGSNIARFQELWTLDGSGPGDSEVLYFVFDLPRGSVATIAELLPGLLPHTRLQRSLVDFWRVGGTMRCHTGSLQLP